MTTASVSEEAVGFREVIWTRTRSVVTEYLRTSVMAPLTGNELTRAHMALPHGSCPGEDGLLVGFFIRYWEMLEIGMRLAFHEIFDSGAMPESLF